MTADNFIDLEFTRENMDSYYIRKCILNSITTTLPHFKGKLLDVGCGKMPYRNYIIQNSTVKEYVGLDIDGALQYDAAIKPDYKWDGITMPFGNEHFDSAFATEVLEHCANPEIILAEINRVIKPDAVFFFTVPFLWPLHEVPNDEFRYTPFSLKRLLTDSGFKEIEIHATGGWHASMAQMLGLWVRRAPIGITKRKWLSKIIKPVIGYLIKKDNSANINFTESQMITGLYGIAYKNNKG